MRLNTKRVLITAAAAQVALSVSGTTVRCVESSEDFLISFDDGTPVPFGIARLITPTDDAGKPIPFKRVDVIRSADALVASNSIVLLIGDAEYQDNRIALFPSEGIRQQSFVSMRAESVDVPAGAAAVEISDGADQNVVNVRNLHASVNLYVSTSEADVEEVPPKGFLIAPGENADLATLNPLFARHSDGAETVSVNVTKFSY